MPGWRERGREGERGRRERGQREGGRETKEGREREEREGEERGREGGGREGRERERGGDRGDVPTDSLTLMTSDISRGR